MNTDVIHTSLGLFRVGHTEHGVAELQWTATARPAPKPIAAAPLLRQLTDELNRYAAGHNVAWKTPLDLRSGTAFQRKVWRVLRSIPHGQTRSYAWVAARVGRAAAARAVGAACGANPVPVLVPCHRVVASNGALGGFSAGLGRKRKLLAIESAGR